MKAIYIYPADIGAYDEYSEKWKGFCMKFGYSDNFPNFLLVANIETNF